MRIVIWANALAINANYRAFPFVALLKLGHDVRLETGEIPVRLDVLRTYDVVYIYRYHDDGVRRVAQALRDAGVGVVWDNDDDLTSGTSGAFGKTRGALRSQRTRSGMARMIQIAHVVTTSSPVLAEQYRDWGAERVRVVENYIPGNFRPSTASRDSRSVVIGWTAGGEHEHDKKALRIRETLERLLDAHTQVRVETVGVNLELQSPRYDHVPFAQYRNLADHVARFDVGIAPIADIPFNRARSDVKVKEYAALGVPWLASPIGPYRDLGEKQGGRLVEDGGWYDALERLVVKGGERKRLAKNAAKWGKRQRVIDNLPALEAPLREAVELSRGPALIEP